MLKALREGSLGSLQGGSVPPDINSMLEKQAKELAKQKENTTKLSKLCLGTLNELEKFEKKQVLYFKIMKYFFDCAWLPPGERNFCSAEERRPTEEIKR